MCLVGHKRVQRGRRYIWGSWCCLFHLIGVRMYLLPVSTGTYAHTTEELYILYMCMHTQTIPRDLFLISKFHCSHIVFLWGRRGNFNSLLVPSSPFPPHSFKQSLPVQCTVTSSACTVLCQWNSLILRLSVSPSSSSTPPPPPPSSAVCREHWLFYSRTWMRASNRGKRQHCYFHKICGSDIIADTSCFYMFLRSPQWFCIKVYSTSHFSCATGPPQLHAGEITRGKGWYACSTNLKKKKN